MAGSIRDRVAIVGMGCTKFGERWDAGRDDMIVEATYDALADAGLGIEDIEAAWLGTAGGTGGMTLSEPLRLQYIPVTRIENACATASDAFRNACYAVAAGIHDIVLAVGADKYKDSGISGLSDGTIPGPGHGMLVGGPPPAMFATLATTYFDHYGLSFEEGKHMIGRVSWKSHINGARHKKAHFGRVVEMDEILNSPMIAWPLGLYDCCGVSDGAAAAIITTPEIAKKMRAGKEPPIFVKALQIAMAPNDGNFNQDYDYLHVEATVRAAERAYTEAGITNPREQISMAEVHDCFSITEAITMEDLRFSERGTVQRDIENGFFDLDGGLPIQPDGGLKCFGHPIGASGIRMIYEMYLQLQGRADMMTKDGMATRQLKDPTLGLTHNLGGGPPGCAIFVGIFGLEGA